MMASFLPFFNYIRCHTWALSLPANPSGWETQSLIISIYRLITGNYLFSGTVFITWSKAKLTQIYQQWLWSVRAWRLIFFFLFNLPYNLSCILWRMFAVLCPYPQLFVVTPFMSSNNFVHVSQIPLQDSYSVEISHLSFSPCYTVACYWVTWDGRTCISHPADTSLFPSDISRRREPSDRFPLDNSTWMHTY